MRLAQKSMAAFCSLVNWQRFNRQNMAKSIKVDSRSIQIFACGDDKQAILWLLRTDGVDAQGMINKEAIPLAATVQIPLSTGGYQVILWHTQRYTVQNAFFNHTDVKGRLVVEVKGLVTDIAILVSKIV
jgi:mannan endo-1,4-beta-mannosidase